MSSIKFNQLTKEIELKGSDAFVESHFSKIQDLLVESFGVKMIAVPRKTVSDQKTISVVKKRESQAAVPEIRKQEVSEAPQTSTAAMFAVPDAPPLPRVNRPPLRKYIRKQGMPGQQKVVVEVVDQSQRTGEISIASLKEKFGLSDSKITGIIRDAEKLGKVKRATDGSYVWS